MKVALAVWNGRIAPVLDVAGTLRVLEIHDGRIEGEETLSVKPGTGIWGRVSAIRDTGADVLVCGAVSGPVHRMLVDGGMDVRPFISGDSEEVLQAFMSNMLHEPRFRMPGCGGSGRGRVKRRSGCRRGFEPGGKEV